jgi:hypothetical protein
MGGQASSWAVELYDDDDDTDDDDTRVNDND